MKSVTVRCARCGGIRFHPVPADGYVCQRCRAVLAGKNAADPLGRRPALTPEDRAALGERLRKAPAPSTVNLAGVGRMDSG